MIDWVKITTRIMIVLLVIVVLYVVVYEVAMKTTKVDYQTFFNKNHQDLTMYAEQFNLQDKIVSINRQDSFLVGLSYSVRRNLSQEKNNNVTFGIPSKYRKREDEFWKMDASKIVSSKGTGMISLSKFLQLCNMNESEFAIWRQFLEKYNVPYIMKDKSNQTVTIGLDNQTGLIYRSKNDVELGYAKLIKLNDKWFYFNEQMK